MMIDHFTRTENFITPESDAWAGHYKVGERIFYSKIDAVLYATKTSSDVTYHFHDDVYEKVNWSRPMNVSLNELYRQRAQQLRDKYDYLVLHYSAGSDSHNILRTFLDNKIHLDEVFVRWPIEDTKRFCPIATRNEDPNNILSEWELTIVPQLEWLKSNYPNQKITVVDTSGVDVLNQLDEEALVYGAGGVYVNIGGLTKQTVTSSVETAMLNKHQKVASIYGANKPCLHKKGSDLYTFFVDYGARNGGGTGGGQTKNVELFYWTPDMPEIVVEQCHVILNYFRNHPEQQIFLEDKHFTAPTEGHYKVNIGNLMKMLMYSTWDYSLFQVDKVPGGLWFHPWDEYLLRHYKEEDFMKRWMGVNRMLSNSISQEFKTYSNGIARGLRPFITRPYYIGKLF